MNMRFFPGIALAIGISLIILGERLGEFGIAAGGALMAILAVMAFDLTRRGR